METKKRTSMLGVFAILLCIALCVGVTYAFFTDSITSKNNKVKAGTLEVDLELLTNSAWVSINESPVPVFKHELWEPGYTEVQFLRVVNNGNLAIKWEAKFISEEVLSELANVIDVYVLTSDTEIENPANFNEIENNWENVGTLADFFNIAPTKLNGTIIAAQKDEGPQYDYLGIALHMPATVVDNALQGKELAPFDIQILATQFTHETDEFGSDYDEDATPTGDETSTPEGSDNGQIGQD